jgi:hypothetical protein
MSCLNNLSESAASKDLSRIAYTLFLVVWNGYTVNRATAVFVLADF